MMPLKEEDFIYEFTERTLSNYKNFNNTELLKELQTSVKENTYNGNIDDESFF